MHGEMLQYTASLVYWRWDGMPCMKAGCLTCTYRDIRTATTLSLCTMRSPFVMIALVWAGTLNCMDRSSRFRHCGLRGHQLA